MADTSNKNEERNEHGFEWPVVVRNSNPHASLDYYYGPYDSIESMKSGVPAEVLVPGFTAAVQTADGVTEYWVVSGSGSSATWEQKGVRHDTYITLKGVKDSLAEVKAIENPSTGDMYLVSEDGESGGFLEYVYTGSVWELLGRNSGKTNGVLTVRESSSEVSFDGTGDVTVDLSDYVKDGDIDLSGYVKKDSLDDYAKKSYLSDTFGLIGGSFVTIGPSDCKVILNSKGVLYKPNNSPIHRLNPLVLALRIISENNEFSITVLYDPFNLGEAVTISQDGNYYYTLVHNLCNKNISTYGNYSVVGSARTAGIGDNGLFVSILEYNRNNIVFVTPNDNSRDPFSRCELYFYDFTSY